MGGVVSTSQSLSSDTMGIIGKILCYAIDPTPTKCHIGEITVFTLFDCFCFKAWLLKRVFILSLIVRVIYCKEEHHVMEMLTDIFL